ncbi:MAG: hypothetical protein ABI947_12600 [Chloroflexota bacterium]
MNTTILYQWEREIESHLPSLNSWQVYEGQVAMIAGLLAAVKQGLSAACEVLVLAGSRHWLLA